MLSERPKVSSRAISKDLLNRIDHLFQSIELAYIVSLECDTDADADSREELELLIKTLNQLSEMCYKSAKLREQNNQRNAVEEDGEECDSVVSNKIAAKATIDEVVSTSTDASVDTNVQGVSADVEIDVNRDAAAEAPLIKGVANPMNHRATLLLRGDPSKEYH